MFDSRTYMLWCDVIENYSKSSRANEILFAYVGGSSMGSWPHGFLAYVEEKQRSKPTARFKRDHKKNVRGQDGDKMMQLWYQVFQIEEEEDPCKNIKISYGCIQHRKTMFI